MKARLRMVGRWYPAGAAVVAAVSCWGTSSVLVLRIALTCWAISYAVIFHSWRSAERRAVLAEQLAERARQQGNEPCPRCQHYACDGVECISCDGPCSPPKLTGPVDHASYWLN